MAKFINYTIWIIMGFKSILLEPIPFNFIFNYLCFIPIVASIPRVGDRYFNWCFLLLFGKFLMKIEYLSYKIHKDHSISEIIQEFKRSHVNTIDSDVRIIKFFQVKIYKPFQKINCIDKNS